MSVSSHHGGSIGSERSARYDGGMNKAEEIAADIAAERKELITNAILTLITLGGLIVGVVGTWLAWAWPLVAAAYAAAYLAGGLPATIEALKALRARSLDINLLMVAAAIAAAGVGEVRDGAILLFLFSLAGTLEGYAMGNTKRAIFALMNLRPDEATQQTPDGATRRVAVETLAIDDIVVVRPGERVPVDGEVVEGIGAVNQAPLTGESVPVDKSPGETVFAGSVNVNAVLVIRVTKLATESTLSRMIELVLEAQEKRSPSERFSEWFGERYTFIVLFGTLAMLGVFILFGIPLPEALYKAATLLVVASPCAIVISVPAAVLSALANTAKHGVLFKGGAALETFGSVTTIAFDKTGTLTSGCMSVQEVAAFASSESTVLALAAALESHSDHPVAQSIVAYATTRQSPVATVTAIEAVPGKGVIGQEAGEAVWVGNRALATSQGIHESEKEEEALRAFEQKGYTTVLIGRGSTIVGAIAVADTPRASTKTALAALAARGVKNFHMLTGDTVTVAQAVGKTLSIPPSSIHGALLPEDKVRVIEALRKEGKVAFVGDGINDAAALATAHVGIAMGVAGSDVAIEAADVALLSDDLERLAYAHRVSQLANRIIRQNLIFAIGIMLVMVVVTTFWYLPLPLGVIGHEGGTLLVVANGLRLLFIRP